tara:strand:+ start:240 stop:560 length:321 start_codon:yes stop_codon:yes gene_type:complete
VGYISDMHTDFKATLPQSDNRKSVIMIFGLRRVDRENTEVGAIYPLETRIGHTLPGSPFGSGSNIGGKIEGKREPVGHGQHIYARIRELSQNRLDFTGSSCTAFAV